MAQGQAQRDEGGKRSPYLVDYKLDLSASELLHGGEPSLSAATP